MSEFVTKVVVEGDNRTGPALAAASKGVENYSKAVQRGNASLRATTRQSRATFTQLGYQAQDVAVQLQAGQSPFMVLSQQGSQIASIFGPGGAVFGAFLAIGGAIAGSLVPNLFKGTTALEDMIAKAKELNKELKDVAPYAATRAEFQNQLNYKKLQDEIAKKVKEINALRAKSIELAKNGGKSNTLFGDTWDDVAEKLQNATIELENLSVQLGTHQKGVEKLEEKYNPFMRVLDEYYKRQERIAEINREVETPLERLQRRTAEITAEVKNLNLSTETHTRLMLIEKGIYEGAIKYKDDAAEKTKKEAEAYEQLKRSLNPAYSATQAYLDTVKQIQSSNATQAEKTQYLALAYAKWYEVMHPANEKLKATTKTVESANNVFQDYADTIKDTTSLIDGAGMNALRSMEDQLSGLVAGTTSVKDAFRSMALGIVNDLIKIQIQKSITGPLANMIAGSSYQASSNFVGPPSPGGTGVFDFFKNLWPFEGGGYTGSGSRSGGLDGKGGFPAMLHPNETVVDHTQGDAGAGVTVVQNINISTGVSQTVRAEIANLMPQISNAAKSAVADARQRGGGFSKAMGA